MVCVSVPTAAVAADGLADAGAVAGADALGTAAAGAGADAAGAGLMDAGADAFLPTMAADGLGGATSAIGGGSSAIDALMSGIASGASTALPTFADIGGDSAISGIGNATSDAATNAAGGTGGYLSSAADSATGGVGNGIASAAPNAATNAASSPSFLSQLESGAAKNPLAAALGGSSILSGIQGLLPKKKVNTAQNASDVLSTNPSFSNPNLPQYSMQNTATPYSGNWYTYGQQPQGAMYNAMPTPVPAAKKGGLIGHYAHGGRVRGYAMGGPVLPMGAPPQGMAPPPPAPSPQGSPPMPPSLAQQRMQGTPMQGSSQQKKPINPLALSMAAHKIGVAIGQHMKKRGMTPDGRVSGHGGGQDDAVPARLSKDEFVMPADVVAHLGDGSSEAGGKKLDAFMDNVRKQKTGTTKYPTKAKNPLSYLPKGTK